jgi:hypothetical protein
VSETTVAKYMPRNRKPPSQTWRAFLKNHAKQLVSVDFFVVPTLSFRLLFVFVVLEHHRRRVVHFNCQGRIKTRPVGRSKSRPLLDALRGWFGDLQEWLERRPVPPAGGTFRPKWKAPL